MTFISDYAEKALMISDAMGYITEQDFRIDRDYFDNNLIMYTLSGCLTVEQYGKHYQVTASHGILMDLRHVHKYYFSKTEHTEILWMHFRGVPCQTMLNTLCEQHPLPFFFQGKEFLSGFESLQTAVMKTPIPNEFEISSLICSIVSRICSQVYTQTAESTCFTADASRYVLTHIDEKINLDSFSRHMNISKYHFCRVFTKATGITPKKFRKTYSKLSSSL